MGLLRFFVGLWVSLFSVAFARARRGPLLPSWPFGFEVITRAQKRFHASMVALPPLEQRRLWGALAAKSPALREVRRREERLGDVRVSFFEPKSDKSSTVLLYLHGGSFIYGSEKSHGDLAARIALASAASVAFPSYRLAPEHPFPAALDDVERVYDALVKQHGARQLVLAGDSAGGNLCLALLFRLRAAGAPLPRAAIPISPWVDLTARGGSLVSRQPYDWAEPEMFERWAETYLAHGEDRTRPEISPAFGDFSGFPPLLVLVGTAELLFDQVRAVAEKARADGAPVTLLEGKDMVHLWIAHAPMFDFCQRDIEAIGRFVRETA